MFLWSYISAVLLQLRDKACRTELNVLIFWSLWSRGSVAMQPQSLVWLLLLLLSEITCTAQLGFGHGPHHHVPLNQTRSSRWQFPCASGYAVTHTHLRKEVCMCTPRGPVTRFVEHEERHAPYSIMRTWARTLRTSSNGLTRQHPISYNYVARLIFVSARVTANSRDVAWKLREAERPGLRCRRCRSVRPNAHMNETLEPHREPDSWLS